MYLTSTPGGTVIGTKDVSGVWKFVNVGGKSNLKCKLQLVTTDNKNAYLVESSGDVIKVIQNEDANNTQWNLGFVSFGPKAFSALLKQNKFLQKECCKGTLPSSLNAICVANKFTPNSGACKSLASAPEQVMYDINGLNVDDENEQGEERTLTVTDDGFGTTEIVLGIGVIVLIGISIYMLSKKR